MSQNSPDGISPFRRSGVLIRAHSFPRQNLTNSAVNLVNSADFRGYTVKIPRVD